MRVIYPPRPEGKIRPSDLSRLESSKKYVVQRKFNGDRCVIHIGVDGKVTLCSRHGGRFDRYQTPAFLEKEILALNLEKKEYWLDAELLHNKAAETGIKNTLVLYDVLQAGEYLYGVNQMDRLAILSKICRNPQVLTEPQIALRVSDHIWMAETWNCEFVSRFNDFITSPAIEGLVLRRIDAFLDNYGVKEYEVKWIIRCRKPNVNYTS